MKLSTVLSHQVHMYWVGKADERRPLITSLNSKLVRACALIFTFQLRFKFWIASFELLILILIFGFWNLRLEEVIKFART